MSALIPLAEELDEYAVTPGVLGFIVFAVLGVAVWILLKSMSKQLTRIDFDDGGQADSERSAADAERSATSA